MKRGLAGVALVAMLTGAQSAEPTAQEKQLKLYKQVTGKELKFSDFQADDAAMTVSAASMAGIAPSAVTIAESTRDVGVFIKGFDSKSKGVGFAISPARVSHPWPKVDLADYLNRRWDAILLTGLTISLAQGRTELDGRNYVRRALAVTTGGTFANRDDAIWVASDALAGSCADEAISRQLQATDPESEPDTGKVGKKMLAPKEKASGLAKCIKAEMDKLNNRWFRSLWSITYAIGDVKQDASGRQAVRLGDTFAVAARWGDGIKGHGPDADFEWGWALSGSAKFTRNDPVLSTLDTAALLHKSTRLVALKGAIGTASMRGIAEYSGARVREAQTGELTLKKAIGLDYRVREGWWLNFRYGKRQKTTGDGDETAGLLTLTISPSTLNVN